MAALAQGGRVTMRNSQGATPLLTAAQYGHTDICGLLLAHGSNVNEIEPNTKQTALHLAAIRGHNSSVEALLSWGAEVNPQDHGGFTPLHAACQEGHLLCVLTLLKAGARLTLPCKSGELPIHLAAGRNRMEIVKTVLEHGCSPDMLSSKKGQTPLMLAARRAGDETVAFLLSKGASPDLMDRNNMTALALAIGQKCSSTIDFLAPVTTKGLDKALKYLATCHTELTPAVEDFLRRSASDEEAVRMGVDYAANLGASSMLKILTQGWDKNTLDSTEQSWKKVGT